MFDLSRISGFENASITQTDTLQTLWGGYGELVRLHLCNAPTSSVIIKQITLPKPKVHPRGWNTDRSHQRKLDSYQVELNWYQDYANSVSLYNPVPCCLYVEQRDNELVLVLEDLATAGFPLVKTDVSLDEAKACLTWLAYFHIEHLDTQPIGLWETGTYWHLDTRPDELEALTDLPLKDAAFKIDRTLKNTRYQTLVHGDAKLANFCFSEDRKHVAAVDFQYIGKGCGMKDVILFISSCIPPEKCAELESELLDHYFEQIKHALGKEQLETALEIEAEWRPLYCIAWADFHRFVKGWSPEHWKINEYTEGLKLRALGVLAL
ncbi:ecdysteroid 22-kinase family protein [Aliivibrio fischeri]|uniref:ecdysteroid 22-kinase family protein n=1 Tax=Aliivibrio fischeri TaxID=668 RepID=UPI001F26FB54|nr:ecdysteroid 22-kinase family protein [Aliivibrio fischeri]MCE4934262.1 ecdysteroid 22-kinase family protein [Aliivibrio fischeri]